MTPSHTFLALTVATVGKKLDPETTVRPPVHNGGCRALGIKIVEEVYLPDEAQ